MFDKTHIDQLSKILGDDVIYSQVANVEEYSKDWSSIAPYNPEAVVKPKTTECVSKLLKYCNEHHIKIVTQGGRTGLCGAAVPQENELVLSLERLNKIINIDETAMTMEVEAGATLEQVQTAAEAVGLQFSLDLSARGSCTIGGNAATNAGGNRVIKYGVMRNLVLGIEAITANGDCVGGMNAMLKNNAGFDLKHLFIGSEGTLGVITKLVLKLEPKVNDSVVALCAADSLENLSKVLAILKAESKGALSAFEVMWADYFDQVIDEQQVGRRPFSDQHNIYALIEFQGNDRDELLTLFEGLLMQCVEQEFVQDVVVAQSIKDNLDLWAIREAIGELLIALKPYIAFDIGLPLHVTNQFVLESKAMVLDKYPEAKYFAFGHLGDGNLHLTISYPNEDLLHAIEDDVLKLAGQLKGTISGEHGIGIIKKDFLKYSRTEEEINLMRLLKKALDPNNILNKGRIFD